MSTKRYIGKLCDQHPELKGERRNGNCPACERERQRTPQRRAQLRANKRTPRYRAWRRERNRTSDVAKANRRMSGARRRARKRNAIMGEAAAINRAFAALSRKARTRRMVIDHVVPIAGCRVC